MVELDLQTEKWVGRSRSFAAMWMPVLAVVLQNTGASEEVFGQLETVVNSLLAAAGAVMYIWHRRSPDGAKLRALPKVGSTATVLSALMLVVIASGCAAGVSKYKGVTSVGITVGQSSIRVGPEALANDESDAEKQASDGIAMGGGQFSEGFMAAILSPVTFVLKGALQALLPDSQ